jgi:hypothetical protein
LRIAAFGDGLHAPQAGVRIKRSLERLRIAADESAAPCRIAR